MCFTCPSVHSVGDSLDTAVRESHAVLALGEVTVTILGGPEVIEGVVILHGVLVVVHGGLISVRVHVGLVGHSWGGFVAHHWGGGGGGSVGKGGGGVNDRVDYGVDYGVNHGGGVDSVDDWVGSNSHNRSSDHGSHHRLGGHNFG